MLVYGRDSVAKARAAADIISRRLEAAGCKPERMHVECLGAGEAVPGLHETPGGLREVLLRITASDARRETIERFGKEFAPLATSGPAGLAGYATGRPRPRPVFAYWPSLVPKRLLRPKRGIRSANGWAAGAP